MSLTIHQQLVAAALLAAGIVAGVTAWRCRRARHQGKPGDDARIWLALAAVFLALAIAKSARLSPWLGHEARQLAKEQGLYGGRRPYQIAATIGVAAGAIALLGFGLLSIRNNLRRYRLAVGCAGLVVAFWLIRFISLHEVDAWTAGQPWGGTALELTGVAGASALACVRLYQLRRRPPTLPV